MEKFIATYRKKGQVGYFVVEAFSSTAARYQADRQAIDKDVKIGIMCREPVASKLVECIERYEGEVTNVKMNSAENILEVYIKDEIVRHIELD